jgi:putative oxidoreductase
MYPKQACGWTVLRVVLGIIFLVHGWQKLFGFGFHGVAGFFGTLGIPLPAITSIVVTLVEFFGGLALLLGLFTRWAAILIAIDMFGAIFFVHLKNGFFNQRMGFEYPLILLAATIALALGGGGAASVDGLLAKRS